MKIQIQKLTKKDIDFVKDLEIECNLENWSKEHYLEETYRTDSINLIIYDDKVKCGFLIARYQTNIETLERNPEIYIETEIYNIAIANSYRNKNLGSMLIEKLIDNLSGVNINKVFLEVRQSNTIALNFYKKNRFREIGIRSDFYSCPTEDAILMSRTIGREI